jgi:phosphate starvation-inducible PhoH-like protein
VEYALELVRSGQADKLRGLFADMVFVTPRGKKIRPKTPGQKEYIEAIRQNDVVFGIGPAGTGKTYLAMTLAVKALKERAVQRLVLTRPAVEAGESLGFLPGDLQDKMAPYLRPLYDALYDLMGGDVYQNYMEKGIIEVAPLAYMRGRTLDDSFIILDEAQNTTAEQLKMFLTRLGFGSKVVITGDITQIDLPKGRFSGLAQIRSVLKEIEGISFVYLSDRDVVRHPLVQKIIRAYEKFDRGHAT